jgi:hypothetical protein
LQSLVALGLRTDPSGIRRNRHENQATHRAPAFEASRFAIDNLKKTVPIWKKEFYEDGEVWIEGGN